jgi:lipopolysaccharide/colanic/teichoic acid biosynthesis glycosyltransferase
MIYRDLGMKRMLDLLVSTLALAIFGPLIVVGGLAVRLTSRGPVLFRQSRVGKDGRLFEIYKLRTMPVDPGRTLKQTTNADPDVLPVGRILRRLKIDELPQILNVMKGNMSLVGPRPCLQQTLADMPQWARRRFEVRPGITGLAQINGNIALTWEERWRHDVHYVDRCTLLEDLWIIIRTVLVVAAGEERFRRLR